MGCQPMRTDYLPVHKRINVVSAQNLHCMQAGHATLKSRAKLDEALALEVFIGALVVDIALGILVLLLSLCLEAAHLTLLQHTTMLLKFYYKKIEKSCNFDKSFPHMTDLHVTFDPSAMASLLIKHIVEQIF